MQAKLIGLSVILLICFWISFIIFRERLKFAYLLLSIIFFVGTSISGYYLYKATQEATTKVETYQLSQKLVFDEDKPFSSMKIKKDNYYNYLDFNEYNEDYIKPQEIKISEETKFVYKHDKKNKIIIKYAVSPYGEVLRTKQVTICYK